MGRSSYRYLTGERDPFSCTITNSNDPIPMSELDEVDIWNSGPNPGQPGSRPGSGLRNGLKKGLPGGGSMPVKVPEWTRNRRGGVGVLMEEEDDEEEAENRTPPHEVVARRARRCRTASFSMHEGIGRTLKGRDLSRMRNAIWEKIGFQD